MLSTTVFTEAGAVALTGAATAGLGVLLIVIELAGAGQSEHFAALRKNLVAFAVPLLVVFAAVAAVALVQFMAG